MLASSAVHCNATLAAIYFLDSLTVPISRLLIIMEKTPFWTLASANLQAKEKRACARFFVSYC